MATHARRDKGKRTDMSHYPPDKVAFRMRTPVWCRTRASEIGPNCVAVIAGLLVVDVLHRLRAAQGIVGLAARHGTDRLDAACAKAIAAGDPSYRTIKGILAVGAESDPTPPASGRRWRRRAPARSYPAVRERHHPAHHERSQHGPVHGER